MNVLMVYLWDVLHTSKNKINGNGTLHVLFETALKVTIT